MAKNPKDAEKVKCDGRTDGRTDGPTKRGVESRSTRIKIVKNYHPLLKRKIYYNAELFWRCFAQADRPLNEQMDRRMDRQSDLNDKQA